MSDVEHLNRLIGRGLPTTVAMDVAAGRLDEEFEVTLWATRREAERWAEDAANRSATFTPIWDLEPSHFYLALDGEMPDDIDATRMAVVNVTVGDIYRALQHGSGRDMDPWSKRYRGKTSVIAYRWAKGLAVTPPLIQPWKGKVVIAGGMHRFHLAQHYGAQTIPVLMYREELDDLERLLPSARSP